MKPQSSRIILTVERAMADLRRGMPVLLTAEGGQPVRVTSGEHYPDKKSIHDGAHPAVKLMKLAGLLPQAVLEPYNAPDPDLLEVSAEAIDAYPAALAHTLEKVSEALVPLPEAPEARFIAFRPRLGHEEHLAIIIGNPVQKAAPLVRVHSSCVTGDIFASLRCDCGSQLHQALRMMTKEGAGILLYMSQEGRGIGIANKLRAYALQDAGMDTVEANLSLGFEADERDFALAAAMLHMLGVGAITLLSNNPAKLDALEQHNIRIADRRGVVTTPTENNRFYLETKARRMGHIIPAKSCGGN